MNENLDTLTVWQSWNAVTVYLTKDNIKIEDCVTQSNLVHGWIQSMSNSVMAEVMRLLHVILKTEVNLQWRSSCLSAFWFVCWLVDGLYCYVVFLERVGLWTRNSWNDSERGDLNQLYAGKTLKCIHEGCLTTTRNPIKYWKFHSKLGKSPKT